MAFSTNLLNLSNLIDQNGSLSKTYQGYSTATKEKISKYSSKRWMNSGMAYRGEFLMQNILEHPKDVEESLLSQVLEASAPLRYFLSQNHLKSLIDRASARKKSLPPKMENRIKNQIALLSSMQVLEESTLQDLKPKVTEMMEKPTPSTAVEVRTLFVRRLMPSECEKLQGFPPNWTEIDTEQ